MGLDWLVKIKNTETNEGFEGIDLDNENFEYPGLLQVKAEWILDLLKNKNIIKDDNWANGGNDNSVIIDGAKLFEIDFETIKDARDKLVEVWEYKEENDDDDYMVNDFDVMIDDVENFNDEQEAEESKWRAIIIPWYWY